MIDIKLFRNGEAHQYGVNINGHAKGEDREKVCASISSLSLSFAGWSEDYNLECSFDIKKGLIIGAVIGEKAEEPFQMMRYGMEQTAGKYPEDVKLTYNDK